MASRSLEITIISGEGLMLSRTRRVKKNAFITVGADQTQIMTSTTMDIDGGSYPTWNDTMFIDIPIQSRFLTLEARCKNINYSGGGDRVLGTVKIPVSDFVGGFTPPTNYLHFLSYRLRNYKGEKNGIVNLSIKVNSIKGIISQFNYSQQPWLPAKTTTTTTATATTTNEISSAEIVTGFPVWIRH